MSEPTIRAAVDTDAELIANMLAPHAATGIVLPRTAADIIGHIANFIVAEIDGQVVGAVALRDFGEGLEEIRSLVVDANFGGKGLGSTLIKEAIKLAISRNTIHVFALTMRPNVFLRLGFTEVDKDFFPQKVWTDCAICKKRDCCDEVAVEMPLKDK